MLCRLKFLRIPNSQRPEARASDELMLLTCRTLDVINKLFSRVLTQTQSLGTHIHFAIFILCPFFTSWDPRYPYNFTQSTPTHTHTNACVLCTRRNIHVYTPTNGRPVREVFLVSIGKQYNTWQTHTRGFHPTDPYEGFLSVLLPRSETPSC